MSNGFAFFRLLLPCRADQPEGHRMFVRPTPLGHTRSPREPPTLPGNKHKQHNEKIQTTMNRRQSLKKKIPKKLRFVQRNKCFPKNPVVRTGRCAFQAKAINKDSSDLWSQVQKMIVSPLGPEQNFPRPKGPGRSQGSQEAKSIGWKTLLKMGFGPPTTKGIKGPNGLAPCFPEGFWFFWKTSKCKGSPPTDSLHRSRISASRSGHQ